MTPSNIQFLTWPVRSRRVHQKFGERGACISLDGKKTVLSNNGICERGYRSLYPDGGHTGADIEAPMWTPLYAATEGVVIEKETEPERGLGFGVVTTLRHYCVETGGYEHFKIRYWHMASIDVDLEERVGLGQYLGDCDNTGKSTGSHLHLEAKPVRKNADGEWENILQDNGTFGSVDPLQYMNGVYALDFSGFLTKAREVLAALAMKLPDIIRYGRTF